MSNLLKTDYQHPVAKLDFDILYIELNKRVQEGLINKIIHPNGAFELFNYTNQCSFEKHWDIYTRISRGLILDISKKRLVNFSLEKFMNYLEENMPLPNESFEITTKYDGSCIFLWFNEYENSWDVSTRGSFNSDQAIWAKKYLYNNIELDHLIKGNTYIAEVIYPANRIVVTYDFQGLVLITAYDENGYEYSRKGLEWLSLTGGFRLVETKQYASVDELVKVAETLKLDTEGFVVRFTNGYRIKIKGQRYCYVHRLISNVTPLCIWEMLCNCEDMENVVKELPSEFKKDFLTIKDILTNTYNHLLGELISLNETFKDKSDKETGIFLQNQYGKCENAEPRLEGFVFACRKNNFLEEVVKKSRWRERFFKLFRPTNNVLPGFIPSNNLNRFSEDM